MPGTLTVKTIQTQVAEIRQEITLDIKPKGAAGKDSAAVKANPHDVGAQAFFLKGGAKVGGTASMPNKAASAMRAFEAPSGEVIEKISTGIPKV
mmetsp:Transcript_342/g.670  ORF Transcript_342/g.670 Transcript_342/m.670 type:complete len:94 (+) Transcript_342:55-336(+)